MAKTHTIGLDIGTSYVRAAQLEFNGDRYSHFTTRLTRYAQFFLPPGSMYKGEVADQALVGNTVRTLLTQYGFGKHPVIAGVGNDKIIVRDINLPAIPLNELRSSLPYQVADVLPMPVEDAVLDFHPTAEFGKDPDRQYHGLLVAGQKNSLNTLASAISDAGADLRMIDLNPLAVTRALTRGVYSDQNTVLLDIGSRVTSIVIAAGNRPEFVRIVLHGGHDISEALSQTLGIDFNEADQLKAETGLDSKNTRINEVDTDTADRVYHIDTMELDTHTQGIQRVVRNTVNDFVSSLRSTLAFYENNGLGPLPNRIVLCGGGSLLGGLAASLSQQIGMPVDYGDPLENVTLGNNATDVENIPGFRSTFATAIGLAFGVPA